MGALVAVAFGALVVLGLAIGVIAGDSGDVLGAFSATRAQTELETQARLYQTAMAACTLRVAKDVTSPDGQPRGWPAPAGGVGNVSSLTCQDGRAVIAGGQPLPAAPAGFGAWVYRRDAAAICLMTLPVERTSETDAAVQGAVRRLGNGQSWVSRNGGLAVLLTLRTAAMPAGSVCDL